MKLQQLKELIKSLKYGEITIKIQDSKIVLIEKTEKFKL